MGKPDEKQQRQLRRNSTSANPVYKWYPINSTGPGKLQNACMPKAIKETADKALPNGCNQSKPHSRDGNTWDRILGAQSKKKLQPKQPTPSVHPRLSAEAQPVNDLINLNVFDPLRTLQFLSSELKSRLKKILPDDKIVHEILLEVQQTIKRLGPFATSSTNLIQSTGGVQVSNAQEPKTNPGRTEARVQKVSFVENLPQTDLANSEELKEGSCQTDVNSELEEKLVLLQRTCRQLQKEKAALQDQMAQFVTETMQLKEEIQKLKDTGARTDGRKDVASRIKDGDVSEMLQPKEKLQKLKDTGARTDGRKDVASRIKDSDETLHLKEKLQKLKEKEDSKIEDTFTRPNQDDVDYLNTAKEKSVNESYLIGELTKNLHRSLAKINTLENSKTDTEKALALMKLEKEKLMVLHKFREDQVKSLENELLDLYGKIKSQIRAGDSENFHYYEENPKNNFILNHKTMSEKESMGTVPDLGVSSYDAKLQSGENQSKCHQQDKHQEVQHMHECQDNGARIKNKDQLLPLSQSSSINLFDILVKPERFLGGSHRKRQDSNGLARNHHSISIPLNDSFPEHECGKLNEEESRTFGTGWNLNVNEYGMFPPKHHMADGGHYSS